MNRGRVGEERGGKETDGYPLTASRQWIGKQIKRDIDRWLDEKEEHKIVISLILVHKGIKGNEEADKLAKSACSKTDTFKKIH
jgi:ribonuclease HI